MKRLIAVAALALGACATPPAPEPQPEPMVFEPVPAPPPVVLVPEKPKPAPQPAKPAKPVIATPKPFTAKPIVVDPPDIVGIDRALEPKDLWSRIRKGFAIQDLKSPLVNQKTKQYVARPEYLQRILDRSKLYLYHIVEEIEKRGLPTELALLPMVESAFNPMAYSRAHASGIWQFIPGTGKRFELEQNSWYDGRRDIVDSTNAALDYLTKLHTMYGDWQLALASYNWGEN
ncbi:MAG TPA: transglycosylase SLT domain-containing protein, partial [Burkholderiales bacterium]